MSAQVLHALRLSPEETQAAVLSMLVKAGPEGLGLGAITVRLGRAQKVVLASLRELLAAGQVERRHFAGEGWRWVACR